MGSFFFKKNDRLKGDFVFNFEEFFMNIIWIYLTIGFFIPLERHTMRKSVLRGLTCLHIFARVGWLSRLATDKCPEGSIRKKFVNFNGIYHALNVFSKEIL